MNINIELTSGEHKDLLSYCKLNNFDLETILKSSYLEGFRIEKYGLLSGSGNVIEKEIIKEVIKYVEVPVVEEKEVIKIEYVEVIKEIPSPPTEIEVVKYIDREVIKEIKVEVPVEKIVYIYDKKEEEVVTNLDNICDKPEPIIIEKIVEVIKEVVVVKEVIKEVMVEKDDSKLKPKLDALQNTVQKLKLDNIEKDRLLKEYEKTIQDIQKFNEGTKAMYLKGSNLDNKL
jgi:hypothetical protein